ncbi:MAG TPA: 3',5'-cyclic-nucleotide phosphodiesterase [Candidatus Deferrimicrobiaceae bacterium]|nr:3',5'-cyclic-nucleotide phosphodiesterase [Candidatus Deferrimicrobiaceae bacterium]
MRIKVLGASGSEVPGHNCPAFLVDRTFLLDAGTIGLSLNIREEDSLRQILLTHAHFDHIKGIPFLLDNLVIRNTGNTITVMSGKEVIDDLQKNIFNDRIWPDFTRIPSSERPVLKYRPLSPSHPVDLNGYKVFLQKVHHTVPAYGYVIEKGDGKAFAYTGDTGPTDLFWREMSDHDVQCLIVEVSFPNRLEELSLKSGHLTAALLEKEIAKMSPCPPRIFVMHVKPQYLGEIEKEVHALRHNSVELMKEGEIITI